MNQQGTFQLPPQMSTVAESVDWVYYFLYWVSVVLFVGIIGTMLYFVWKYRRRPGVKAEPTGHNTALEIGWTFAPLILLALLFHWGFKSYMDLTVAPANAMDIRVRARKWSWDFEYPNGGHSVNELHVPVNRPVRLVMSSEDVIHSFFVPAFRIKRDAVPGMYGMAWFQATQTGTTDFFCAEYCGAAATPTRDEHGVERYTGHFSMIGHVVVETQAQYDAFLERIMGPPPGATTEEWGQQLYRQNQCFTCHSTDGSRMTGPTFRGLFGRRETFTDGSSATVDENYLRESILNPQAKIVQGFPPVMPTFRGALNDRQIDALISYIRSLR
jgi:cytochrome c oxidase subunit 2